MHVLGVSFSAYSPTEISQRHLHVLLLAGSGGFTAGSANGQKQNLAGSNAKYRSMMPSDLPIPDSSTYLTIPPAGLSPTKILDSKCFPKIRMIDKSPVTGALGSAFMTELNHPSAVAEEIECKDINTRSQGLFESSCCQDNAEVVPKLVTGPPESTSLPTSLLKFELATGQSSVLPENVSQVNNCLEPVTLIASASNGFTTAELAPGCLSDRTITDGHNCKKHCQKQLKRPVSLDSTILTNTGPPADSNLFCNSLAGMLPSPTPLTNAGAHSLLTSAAPSTETMSRSGNLTAGTANGKKQSLAESIPKYRSMMPSRLPIPDNSIHLTIPPGLSPTALLDSPCFPNMRLVDTSPITGILGSAFKTEVTRPSAVAEGVKCKDIVTRPQGLFASSCCPDNAEVVPKLVTGSPESTSLPASLLEFKAATGQSPVFQQNSSQMNNCMKPVSLITHAPDGPTAAQLADIAPHCLSARTIIDGYNWKKYGQKQLKNAEFPRSYYKCTHPTCPVKKQVECSLEGETTEITYKGDHNHPKPRVPRRGGRTGSHSFLLENNVEAASVVSKPDSDRFSEDFPWSSLVGLMGSPEQSFGSPSMEEADNFEQFESEDEGEAEQVSKCRRTEKPQEIIPDAPVRTIREPRVIVQTASKVDILDDGYRWCKYGQKVVKGKIFPRRYYKCTNVGCAVRKHVERSSTDPTSVVTAYEGKHNHRVPAARGIGQETIGDTTSRLPFGPYKTLELSSAQSPAIPHETQMIGSRVYQSFYEGNDFDASAAPLVSMMENNGGKTISDLEASEQSMGLDLSQGRHLDVGGMHRQGLGSNFYQPLFTSTSCVTGEHFLGP